MTSGFADATISQRVRDAIEAIARGVVREEGTTYRYGTVQTIDYENQLVTVLFPGGGTAVPVKTLGVQPTAVGQVVQVAGRKGDHFVSGVVGTSSIVGAPPDSLVAPTLGLRSIAGGVVAEWTSVTGAASYEVDFAESADFLTNPSTYQLSGQSFTYYESDTGKTIYSRVRALTSHDPPQAGPYSATDGPESPSAGQSTDGNPPADSPDVALVSGIGYLQANWPAQANADGVIYEVHIDTNSGFTPSALTLYDETTGLTSFIKTLADGTPLAYDTNYYVRILAKDADGEAPTAGAQAIAQIDRVETDDAGNIGVNNVSDGAVPSTSPDVGNVTSGIGYLFVTWAHIANADPVSYELHVSTVNDFTPDANTLVGDTPSNYFFVRKQGPGAGGAPLAYATTYYIKIIAYDADGYAASFGAQGSGSSVKGASGDIDDDAIGTVHIQDLAVTTALIADAAIDTAKIVDAAITTAKIADAQISTAKIQDLAVGNAKISDLAVDKITAGNLTADVVMSTGEIKAAGTGGSIIMDGDGLRLYPTTDWTGSPNVELKTVDGSATFTGLITGSTITGSDITVADEITLNYNGISILADGTNVGAIKWASGLNFTGTRYFAISVIPSVTSVGLRGYEGVTDISLHIENPDLGGPNPGSNGTIWIGQSGPIVGNSFQNQVIIGGSNTVENQLKGHWNFTDATFSSGDSAWLAFSFHGDTDTGFYRPGNNQIMIVTGGSNKFLFGSTKNTSYQILNVENDIEIGGVRFAWDAGVTIVLENINEIRSVDGSNSDPPYTFTGEENTGVYLYSSGHLGFAVTSTRSAFAHSTGFFPGPVADNARNLGNGSNRWAEVWAVDTSINSSDPRMKADIAPLGGEESLDLIRSFRPIRGRWKDKGKRTHTWFDAEQIGQELDRRGIDLALYIDPSRSSEDQVRVEAEMMVGLEHEWDPEEHEGESYEKAFEKACKRVLNGPKGLRIGEIVPILARAVSELADRMEASGI